ncbi:hypothetical protein MYX84_15955 [Acidobacteria bacterium AH-259-O06]|nr:hypothetical protein [Acidobacteria bacterium AH-259-O06]
MDYEYWTTVSPDRKPAALLQLLCDAFPNFLDLHFWLESAGVRYMLVASLVGEEKFSVEADHKASHGP